MRFVVFMIPRVYQPDAPPGQRADEGFTPPADAVAKMMKYNEELAKAGLLLSLDGLKPLISGARVAFSSGKPTVTDGPFVESKEVVGGFWMIQAKSKEEAIEWVKRCPAADGDVIEIRPVFELSDFPPETQKAAKMPKNQSE